MLEFNSITTRSDLADYLGIPRKLLSYVLYIAKVDSYYVEFDIKKKSGKLRHICSPTNELKGIQRQIADSLYKYQEQIRIRYNIKSNISHGFEKNKSIISNACVHRNKRYIINVDLKDFFDSFHFGRVSGYFQKNKYFELSYEVSTILAQLSCYKGKLPQGSPCSPIIANLICQIFDIKVIALAKKYKLDYTRYADDLTFSTNNKTFTDRYQNFINDLENVVEKNGLHINPDKTSFQYRESKHCVTGITVNKILNVDHNYYKTVRSKAHSLYINDYYLNQGVKGTINQLEGMFSFIDQVDIAENKRIGKVARNAHTLTARERQYQKFLFYKYFYANPELMVITEGKTDVVYIKCALRKLYKDYPGLITKNSDGSFTYNITFLRRSKRFRDLFALSLDGADAMAKLYENFFKANNKHKHLETLEKLSGRKPLSPVIFIFDNELITKDKPIEKFIRSLEKSLNALHQLKNKGFIRLRGNLFLTITPLVRSLNECEIEDLFDNTTLNHQINGKTFSRDSDYDKNVHYGKDDFSKYVATNYRSIDFSNFKRLLDNMQKIVIDYIILKGK